MRMCAGAGGRTLLGLLSHTERKNSWWLAEFAGEASPDGMQRLLNFSPWDEDACRDAVARYVVRRLGDPGAVLAVDETGFLKKGRMSAGVARQYTGTAGRVENCQVGVFLAYCAPDGARALIDRELYIPKKWAEDRERCRAAGIGDDVTFATKPQLAKAMIGRAVKAGVPFKWVAGRRGLRRQPRPAGMAGGGGDPVRARGRVQRRDRDEGGREARRRARGTGPGGRVAAAELRRRVEGTAAV